MEALLAALPAGGGGAVAAAVGGLAAAAAVAGARMGNKERANTPPGSHDLTESFRALLLLMRCLCPCESVRVVFLQSGHCTHD